MVARSVFYRGARPVRSEVFAGKSGRQAKEEGLFRAVRVGRPLHRFSTPPKQPRNRINTRASRARRHERGAAHRLFTTIQHLYQHLADTQPVTPWRELYTNKIAYDTRITQRKLQGVAICWRVDAITGGRITRAGTFSPFATTDTIRRFFRRAFLLPNPHFKLPVRTA